MNDAPTATIDLDRPRTLRADLNALIDFQAAMTKYPTANPLITVRVLLWASLRADDPELTLEAAGALVSLHNLKVVDATLTSLWDGLNELTQEATDSPFSAAPSPVKPRRSRSTISGSRRKSSAA